MDSEQAGTVRAGGTVSDTSDFTEARFARLLELAKAKYPVIRYGEVNFAQPFLLWRHDCDMSLQRALALAELEQRHGVVATYFLLPHSRHYNLLDKDSARIVVRILELGHQIGLHFDAAYYGLADEDRLSVLVHEEAQWLRRWFGAEPAAFSFHDPDAFCLGCEQERYGGLLNCYSRAFKERVAYCSDSNGYWRHRPLHEVLAAATDRHLQVLTHPEHWQAQPMQPRERVFRAVYGRARAALAHYDAALERAGRGNLAGPASAVGFMRARDPRRHALLDFLWNSGERAALAAELGRLYDEQRLRLCVAHLRLERQAPAHEVNALVDVGRGAADRFFAETYGVQPESGVADACGEGEEDCVRLAQRIESLAQWGIRHAPGGYDGLGPLAGIGIETAPEDPLVLKETPRP